MVQSSSSELSSFLPFFSLTVTETETLIKVFKLTKKKFLTLPPSCAAASTNSSIFILEEKRKKDFSSSKQQQIWRLDGGHFSELKFCSTSPFGKKFPLPSLLMRLSIFIWSHHLSSSELPDNAIVFERLWCCCSRLSFTLAHNGYHS